MSRLGRMQISEQFLVGGNWIGICVSASCELGNILKNRGLNVKSLCLHSSAIYSESTVTLADSLKNNTKLRYLGLGNNCKITIEGWQAILDLNCNCTSIDHVLQSNHTLCHLGLEDKESMVHKRLDNTFGFENAHILRASLSLNCRMHMGLHAAHCKIIWGHFPRKYQPWRLVHMPRSHATYPSMDGE